MTKQDPRTGRFTAERTTTTVTERVTIEPAPGPLLPEARARLAAPLPYPSPPVIFTPAMRAADDDYRDHLRARALTDRADVREWHAQARVAVFGPCRDPLLRQAATLPAMLP